MDIKNLRDKISKLRVTMPADMPVQFVGTDLADEIIILIQSLIDSVPEGLELISDEEIKKALLDCADAFYDADTEPNASHNFVARAQLAADQKVFNLSKLKAVQDAVEEERGRIIKRLKEYKNCPNESKTPLDECGVDCKGCWREALKEGR